MQLPEVNYDPFSAEFKSFLTSNLDDFHVPSTSIGVVNNNDTFFHIHGDARLNETAATEDTLYYIASVTKSFTATTLLSLLTELSAQQGDAAPTLKSKISSLLPGDDFVLPDAHATAQANLDDALGHLLGIANPDLSYGGYVDEDAQEGEKYSLRSTIRSLRHLATTAEFREKHHYLNIGYMLIQHVIETLTDGTWIGASHHKYIWDPLGMTSTYIKLSDARDAVSSQDKVLATGYSWDAKPSSPARETPYTDDWPLVGGGGIITSIRDLTRYLSAVVHRTLPHLSPENYDELFRPRSIQGDLAYDHHSTSLYCAGWEISTYRGHRLAMHSGGIFGFSSKLAFLPDRKWGVAILSNSDLPGALSNELAMRRLIDDHLGVPPDERQDIKPILQGRLNAIVEAIDNTRSKLYPSIPDPPLPLSLPLTEYAGTYHNPAYRNFTFTVASPPSQFPLHPNTTEVLHTTLHRLSDITIDLEHVSGEYFIAWYDAVDGNIIAKAGLKAQFDLGQDGKVTGLTLGLDPFDRNEDVVARFDKIS